MPDNGSITIKLDEHTARQLAERAREEGVTPEQYAAELLVEALAFESALDEAPPALIISDEELRASIERQMRELEDGTAVLYTHEQVMAGARAILAKART